VAGRASKVKGSRVEREIVKRLNSIGLKSQRIPLSGSVGGNFQGDILIDSPFGGTLRAEVKARKNGEGFVGLLKWLGEHELLFLRKDKEEPVVVMTWELFEDLVDTVVAVKTASKSIDGRIIYEVNYEPKNKDAEQRGADPVPSSLDGLQAEDTEASVGDSSGHGDGGSPGHRDDTQGGTGIS
jgi:hypothetical protein